MRVAIIKGLTCLVAVLTTISTMLIITTDSKIKQSEEGTVTTQITTEVTTTKKVEETTEKLTEATTEQVTEKPTEITTVESATTVEPTITAEYIEMTESIEIEEAETSEALYSASEFMNMGVIHWNGWKWTYYSEAILPGYGLNIPGRHNDDNGYICDENDYICLASSSLTMGTVIDTPFGNQGKIYDSGCAEDVIDVYVSW